MDPPEAMFARPRRQRGRPSSTANRDSKRVAVRAHKANNKAQRKVAKPRALKGPKKNTPPKPAPSPQPQDRVDSLNPCDEEPAELSLPPPLHPLTVSNLRAHTRQTNPEMAASQLPGSSGPKTLFDKEESLRLFGAKLDSDDEIPQEIRDYIKRVTNEDTGGPPSPRAKHLHDCSKWAQRQDEANMARKLALDLMAAPADMEGGEKYVVLFEQANFHPRYVTRPPHPDTSKEPFILTQSRPDYTNGYITRADAGSVGHPRVEPPFTEEQERKLLSGTCSALHRDLHCPWLTVQFKAFGVQDARRASKMQCCRDGIAANQYMHRLFQCAGPDFQSSIVDTSHWSLSCDGETVQLYIHYRLEKNGAVEFHLRTVSSDFLRGDISEDVNPQIVRLRKRLRNVLRHAQNARLDRIKDALACMEAPGEQSPRKPTQSILKSLQTSSGIGGAIPNAPNLTPPDSSTGRGQGPPRSRPATRSQQPVGPPAAQSAPPATSRAGRDLKPTKPFWINP